MERLKPGPVLPPVLLLLICLTISSKQCGTCFKQHQILHKVAYTYFDLDEPMDDHTGQQGERPDHYAGHSFGQSNVYGGYVHLGDTYYPMEGQHFRRPSAEWQARPNSSQIPSNEEHLYIVPRQSSFQFTGRRLETTSIERFFSLPISPTIGPRHKITVLYGLGGSGKTQVCLRYAETFRAS